MKRAESIIYSDKWKVCVDGYEIRDIDYKNPPEEYFCDETNGCFSDCGTITQITKLIVPQSNKWREYEFPLPKDALWFFLGHSIVGSENNPQGKFLSEEELLKWTNKYGFLNYHSGSVALEDLQFEQSLLVAVYRLLERYSELERTDDGKYYVDGVQLDRWDKLGCFSGPPEERGDVISGFPNGIELDMNLIASQHVLLKRLNAQVSVYPRIVASEGVIRIEKNLHTSLLGNIWIDLLDALFGEESKTARCIFCGKREYLEPSLGRLERIRKPSRGIKGYYHEKCRQRFWRQGDRHPEVREELNRKYGLTWGTKGRGK